MRLCVRLHTPQETLVPINYQEFLTAAIYSLLETSNADFARALHDEGYPVDDGPKRFKLFHFGWLRGRHRAEGERLRFAPGPIEWRIGSPVSDFLTHCATGLLAAGHIRVGSAAFAITDIETLPTPAFTSAPSRLTCLSPIVCAKPLPDGRTRFLRPTDGDEFSEAVRKNLLLKYQVLHGRPPEDDTLHLTFDAAYLESKGGTKKMTYKGIDIIGAFAPFMLAGSAELQRVGWECGLGEKNAGGFGMVERAKI